MTRGRFGLLLAFLVLVVGGASFAVVYSLADGGVDAPPGVDGATGTTALPTTSPTTPVTGTDGLTPPTFVVVVSSEADQGAAQAIRDGLTEGGYDSGVLHSDDYSSLQPGFWVAYVGPFADVATADAAKAQLIADGYPAAYSRCVGTKDQC